MSKPVPTTICLACNRAIPSQEYARNSVICHFCAMLSPNEVAILAVRTHESLNRYLQQSVTGRKDAKRSAKLAQLELTGKRCTHCHARKAPAEFNKCAPMADGLQPGCRSCNRVQYTILRNTPAGGLKQWHIFRDALRAQNDPK